LHKFQAIPSQFIQLISTVMFSLILFGCSAGGGGSSPNTATATITSISPAGMVQSTTARAFSLTGTNFANGMTVSVTDNLGVSYATGTVTVQTSNLITGSVTITTAPASRYVTIAVKSSSGTTLATTTLGVASVSKTLATHIQPIFTASCAGCHTGLAAENYLDLSSYAASAGSSGPINNQSIGCSSRLRIKPGDPRASSSFLIDKISNTTPCSGNKMTGSPTLMTQTEIDAMIEWVAGGAN
jgi:hypothetical protein